LDRSFLLLSCGVDGGAEAIETPRWQFSFIKTSRHILFSLVQSLHQPLLIRPERGNLLRPFRMICLIRA
jgi:hypothetical protein